MKTPTITKQQAVAALVELVRRQEKEAAQAHKSLVKEAERELSEAVKRFVSDPQKFLTLVPRMKAEEDSEYDRETREHTHFISLSCALDDPEVVAAHSKVTKLREESPGFSNYPQLEELYNNKLTGCDPQSLLSVPENVAAFRALLNGLQLLPESYDSLAAAS